LRSAPIRPDELAGTLQTPHAASHTFSSLRIRFLAIAMPPKKQHDDAAAVKEKLQGARDRRNGRALNGSSLKEVDNASVHSGQTASDTSSSNVRPAGFGLPLPAQSPRHDAANTRG
jgi:hypothetical protein